MLPINGVIFINASGQGRKVVEEQDINGAAFAQLDNGCLHFDIGEIHDLASAFKKDFMIDVNEISSGRTERFVTKFDIGGRHFAIEIKNDIFGVNSPRADWFIGGQTMSHVHAEPGFADAASGENEA